jgi:hypothetical protein
LLAVHRKRRAADERIAIPEDGAILSLLGHQKIGCLLPPFLRDHTPVQTGTVTVYATVTIQVGLAQ